MALTPEQWAQIRAKYESGAASGEALAREFGVSGAAISKTAKKQGWVKHGAVVKVKAPPEPVKAPPEPVEADPEPVKPKGVNRKGRPLIKDGDTVRALLVEAKDQMREVQARHNHPDWLAWKERPDAIDEFCEFITVNGAEGSLAEFCRRKGFGYSMLHKWITDDAGRYERYSAARGNRGDVLFDSLMGIASKEPERGPDGRIDPGWVQWQRLIVDTAKWGAAKLNRTYAERTDVNVTGSVTAQLDRDALEAEIRKLAGKGLRLPSPDIIDVVAKPGSLPDAGT